MNTIIIADDHPITLSGVKSFVEKLGYKVIGAYNNGITAYNNIIALKPAFVILDLSMPGMNGLEVLEKIRLHNKSITIILYTMYNEKTLFEKAKNLEVNGYLLKEFALEELEDCLKTLTYQRSYFSANLEMNLVLKNTDKSVEKCFKLSASEKKIISLIADGKTSKEIGDLLFIAEKTVENHRSNVIKKLELPKTKNALLLWALENFKQ